MICGCKNGISSYEIARALGVSQKTAWFMLHRIREAFSWSSGTIEKLSGEIEADETFIGGKVSNMHRHKERFACKKESQKGNKTVVLGLLQRDGRVRAAVAPSAVAGIRYSLTLRPTLSQDRKLYTDELPSYNDLPEGITHEFVNHLTSYVMGRVHTNGMENFWSLLKRTLKGTYVSVDPVHLQAYVDEQAFRFNNREFRDADRFVSVLSQIAGHRLTFKELITKELDANLG